MPESADETRPARWAYWTIMALGVLCVVLSMVIAYLLIQRPEAGLVPEIALQDPDVRQQVVAQLVAENAGIYDSHVDADVGRILQPNLPGRPAGDVPISTNRFGIRERDYALPKPPDVLRVVILGDSFVFGWGVRAEERLGAHLEPWLTEQSTDFTGRIEVLHIGVASWTFTNEAAYLRRQLSDLQPDLVFHISAPNDIDDGPGTRGFGVPATFSPQMRKRADSMINAAFPMASLGFSRSGYLRHGIDYEGLQRYRTAVAEVQRLASAVEHAGGRYRLILHHRHQNPITWTHLGRYLDPTQVVFLADSFGSDEQYWNSKRDPHWNPAGNRIMAQLLYGLILRDGLLPQLTLTPWDEADQVVEKIAVAGRAEAEGPNLQEHAPRMPALPIASRIDFEQLDAVSAAQVHGGIDRERRVSPYASFVLKNEGGRQLRIQGRTFPRPELDGAQVQVFIDAEQVGSFELRADTELDLHYAVPEATTDRPYLTIRFESDDYVYAGPDLQHCAVFWLKRLALET